MAYGTRGGGSFRRAMDEQFKIWTERLLGGEEPGCSRSRSRGGGGGSGRRGRGGETCERWMTDPLPTSRDAGTVVKSWDAAEGGRERKKEAAA